jgi:hypothetical protein
MSATGIQRYRAANHSGYAIAACILACAVVSLIAASRLVDYTNKDISREYDDARTNGDSGHATPAT